MCGIYGCVLSNGNAYTKVKEGLSLLQYRGYDSCGIAYYKDGNFEIVKAVGAVENLVDPKGKYNIAFGHTRWATHGEVNLLNAHPHYSFNHEFTIVHNGIIKNADEIKTELVKRGMIFYSQTDTEVVANLLCSFNGTNDERMLKLIDTIKGSYSLIVATKQKEMYLIKQFSPLHILKTGKDILISSDKASLPTGKIYTLSDGDIIKIAEGQVTSVKGEMKFIDYDNDIERLNKGHYAHFMLKEIYETPEAIKKTYNNIKDTDFKALFAGIKNITLIGCGTAYHSCLIGDYYFNKYELFLSNAYLASNYECRHKIKKDHLHIIVSQSGETADCIKVAENIKQHGGKILLITNEAKSTLTRFADNVVLTKANKEIAVASTKTYCCQAFVFEYIANVLYNPNYALDIDMLYADLTSFLNNVKVDEVAEQYIGTDKMIMIGKGLDYLLLQEASLKIREIDYFYTIPMYAGELKHGTLSLVDENTTVLTLNTAQTGQLDTAISEIKSRQGKVIEMEKLMPINLTGQEYKAVFAIIPFQLLSYQLAVKLGHNPDMPKNLAKSVTVE